MSSRFQKSEEDTNFRHSVQGKILVLYLDGNFGNDLMMIAFPVIYHPV